MHLTWIRACTTLDITPNLNLCLFVLCVYYPRYYTKLESVFVRTVRVLFPQWPYGDSRGSITSFSVLSMYCLFYKCDCRRLWYCFGVILKPCEIEMTYIYIYTHTHTQKCACFDLYIYIYIYVILPKEKEFTWPRYIDI